MYAQCTPILPVFGAGKASELLMPETHTESIDLNIYTYIGSGTKRGLVDMSGYYGYPFVRADGSKPVYLTGATRLFRLQISAPSLTLHTGRLKVKSLQNHCNSLCSVFTKYTDSTSL